MPAPTMTTRACVGRDLSIDLLPSLFASTIDLSDSSTTGIGQLSRESYHLCRHLERATREIITEHGGTLLAVTITGRLAIKRARYRAISDAGGALIARAFEAD